jgi:TM2 domain-containing membrane protein YozV
MNKNFLTLLLLSISLFIHCNLNAINEDSLILQANDLKYIKDTSVSVKSFPSNELLDTLNTNYSARKKKIIAALFAFPFPFGFVGAHRVVLGTKPWVPVVYIATFGGCFGVLPLIDFCTIVFTKHIEQFENDPNIFMLLKD